MKVWKKVLGGLVMATVATVVLAGCGTASAEDAGNTLTIGVWGGNEAEERALNEMIEMFEQKTGARIEKRIYTDYNTQIQADLIGGTAPDAFYVDASMLPFLQAQGVLAPLSDDFAEGEFYESLTEAFTVDGTLYSAPKDFSSLALYVNTDIFEAVGVSVDEIPSSYEEMVTWLPGFQEKLDAHFGGGVHAMSYTPELSRGWHLAARQGAQPINEDGTANLSDSNVVENLSILSDLVGTGAVVTPQEIGTGWNGEAFGSGMIAIMDEGNWVYQTLRTEFPDINFVVKDMLTYRGEKGSMLFTVGWSKFVNSQNSELAREWIRFASGFEGMLHWTQGTGTLPSRQDVSEASTFLAQNESLRTHLAIVDYATPWQFGTTLMTVENAYNNFLPQAMNGTISLQAAMQQADTQANDDITRGNN